jgi:hypothetical protein
MGKYIQLIKKIRKIYGAACRNAGRVVFFAEKPGENYAFL